MRAEGPKERPTAVLCVQLSARYVQIRQTAKIRNTTPCTVLYCKYIYIFSFYYLAIWKSPKKKKIKKNKKILRPSGYYITTF